MALALVAIAAFALAAPAQARVPNPCLGATDPELLCPDIEMSQPFNLRTDRSTWRGHTLLRAANSVNSIGDGPIEVRGWRAPDSIPGRTMRAVQRVHRIDGSKLTISTGAGLVFKPIPGQGGYWKFNHPAQFELWRLNSAGNPTMLAKRGPKVAYCLRDLVNSFPELPGPFERVYPACSQSRGLRGVTLGTSVGWSDVYPATYHEQWIDVTGLSGCFAYVHRADPRDTIYEINEANNFSAVAVRLPWRGAGARGCRMNLPPGPVAPAAAGPATRADRGRRGPRRRSSAHPA